MKKYDYIRLEPAENGYVLRYDKYEKPDTTDSKFANCCCTTVTEVYTNDQLQEAMDKMKFLLKED